MSSRICYVPPVLPDELLYSFLARLQAYNAFKSPKAYLEQIFGTKDIVLGIDLPTRIYALGQRLGQFAMFDSPEDLINTATLYPYHRPFLTIERHNAVQEILLFGGGKGLKVLLGRVANRFGANPPLRYCICCHQEDIDKYGVPYWHRSHQLPGITCCSKHHLDLIVYATPEMLTDKQRLAMPPGKLSEGLLLSESRLDQINFAQLSLNLLEAKLPALNPLLRQRAYRAAVKERNFCSRKKDIDHDALADAIRFHYEDFKGFAHRHRLLATTSTPLSWLRPLLDRPTRSLHPICHLVLIGFLFGTIENYRQAVAAVCEVGTVLIPEACKGNGSLGSKTFHASYDQLIHDVSISCSRLAKILNISVTTAVIRRRALGLPISERRKHLDAEKLMLMRMLLAKGLSPTVIAKQVGVSVSSVYRLLAESPVLIESHYQALRDKERRKHRRIWLHAINVHQNAGSKAIRAIAADTYAWLYRHDRGWLLYINAITKAPINRRQTVNWAERDLALCRRLELYLESVMSNLNRPRISKTLMLNMLGDAMVRANTIRLPYLQALIVERTESLQSFQFYRIERAIQQLKSQQLPIKLWRIQRLAGIREFSETLRTYANRKIDALSKEDGLHGATF